MATVQGAVKLDDVAVYPNPSNGNFTVRFAGDAEGAVSIKVSDALGREVRSFRMAKQAGAFEETLDLNSLDNGVYMLQINDGKNKTVKRIVKQ